MARAGAAATAKILLLMTLALSTAPGLARTARTAMIAATALAVTLIIWAAEARAIGIASEAYGRRKLAQ